jgi:hypothetical protein
MAWRIWVVFSIPVGITRTGTYDREWMFMEKMGRPAKIGKARIMKGL